MHIDESVDQTVSAIGGVEENMETKPTIPFETSGRAPSLQKRSSLTQVETENHGSSPFHGSNPFHLHFKCDERAVNQGLCYFNADMQTYYMKSRKACLEGQKLKEIIVADLERPVAPTGHSHAEFFITGKYY